MYDQINQRAQTPNEFQEKTKNKEVYIEYENGIL